jgi:hypothetical protein
MKTTFLVLSLWALAPQDPDPKVGVLIKRLDSDSPEERGRAAAELVAMGDSILPALEKVLSPPASPEAAARARSIIRDILVSPEIRGLIQGVTSGRWSWYGAPDRPALRDDVQVGVAREVRASADVKAAYAQLVSKRAPGDAADWKEQQGAVDLLKKAKAVCCLATGLYHSSYLTQLKCGEALAELKDLKGVPTLLDVAEALGVPVDGSKQATVHGFRQYGIARSLDKLLGTSVSWKGEGQNTEALRRGLAVWREAYERGLKAGK